MSDLLHRPVTEVASLLADRKLSPVELMEATLARIDETHEALNAFVTLRDPEACLADARAADGGCTEVCDLADHERPIGGCESGLDGLASETPM